MKIIAVFKTHFDIGFTKLASEVVEQYGGKMLDDVLATCEGTQKLGAGKQYVWTMSSWPLCASLGAASADKRARAEKLIERGQLVWHGLPFTTHTEFLSADELDYGCKIAARLSKKYGKLNPVSAKMTDVPGHTAGLIRVLKENGIRFLHLGCNPASRPPKVPLLFWWEDLEGNRVLTMYNNTYGSGVLPPADWKYPVWLAMRQTNDNIGPQGPEVIEELLEQVGDGNELFVGTMDDFYKEISKEDLSDLPVVRGDLGDTWIHGVGTYPKEVSMIRRARMLMGEAKEAAQKSGADISSELSRYYQNVLLFGEHTWGLDVKTHLGWQRAYNQKGFTAQRVEPRYDLMEKSWNEQRVRAQHAQSAALAAAEKAGVLKEEQIAADPASPYKVYAQGGRLYIVCPDGSKLSPQYEYRVIPTQKMHDFMRSYVTRFWGWSIADFGRESYPEYAGCINKAKLVSKENLSGGAVRAEYKSVWADKEGYGDCASYAITLTPVSDGVLVKLELKSKSASPMLEAGNFTFRFEKSVEELRITKSGIELDPRKDIVEDANVRLFCLDRYAIAGNVGFISYDAPLVSFDGNAIYESNIGTFMKKKAKGVTFNLFNNMWGTNFPQWTEGDFTFVWKITTPENARK